MLYTLNKNQTKILSINPKMLSSSLIVCAVLAISTANVYAEKQVGQLNIKPITFSNIKLQSAAKRRINTAALSKVNKSLSIYQRIANLNPNSAKSAIKARMLLKSLSKMHLSGGFSARYQQVALNNKAFVAGAQAYAKKHGASNALKQLRSNPGIASTFSGASNARKAIASLVQSDFNKLKAAKKALLRLQKSQKLSLNTDVLKLQMYEVSKFQTKTNESDFISSIFNVIGISAANASFTAVVVGALGAAAVIVIASYAEALSKHYNKPEPTEANQNPQSDLQKCQARADERFDKCMREADRDFFKEAGCQIQGTSDAAACLLIPK